MDNFVKGIAKKVIDETTALKTEINSAKGHHETLADFLNSIIIDGGGTPSNVILFDDWTGEEPVIIDDSPTSPEEPEPPIDTTPPILTITPTGTFIDSKIITMSVNEEATIYFTLDGSIPTLESSEYLSPITISESTTLKALAQDTSGNFSEVQTVVYTKIDPPSTSDNNVVTVENGYFQLPSKSFDWGAHSSLRDENFVSITTTSSLLSMFDTGSQDAIIFENLPYVEYSPTFTNNYFENSSIGTGSLLGRIVIKLAANKGTSDTERVKYVTDKLIKIRKSSTAKTLVVDQNNVLSVTTRTSGVNSDFEYVKVALNNFPSDYPTTVIRKTLLCSLGIDVSAHNEYVFSRTYPNLKLTPSESSLEWLMPKGTFTSLDQQGVKSFLANNSLVIYYP